MAERNITVSIVEDTEDIREVWRILIDGSPGYECIHVFANAEQALVNLPKEDIDVVLMDINLPGMDGIECMKELKPLIPDTQFMMFTVYDDDEHIFNALKSGASGYILKGAAPTQILEAIQDLHEGGSPMSSEIARRVVESMQRTPQPSNAIEVLTDREKEILNLLAMGNRYKEIAIELSISLDTVKKHIHNIYKKLHVQTRTRAVNKVFPR